MGHYYSEMTSDAEFARQEAKEKAEMEQRVAKIEAAITEKGLARFLAELEVSSFTHKIKV
jgi:hypothetical protein